MRLKIRLMNYIENIHWYKASTPMDFLDNIDTVKKLLQAIDYLEAAEGRYALLVSEIDDSIVRTQNIFENGHIIFNVHGKEFHVDETTPVVAENPSKGEFAFVAAQEKNGVTDKRIFLVRIVEGSNFEKILLKGYKSALQAELLQKAIQD